jgi:glycosyltransferase involved in cell wall biosynthesis
MNKVLLITNIPSSYRVDFYNLLATTDKIDCHFLFVQGKDTSHKKIIWGNNDNNFYKKSVFVDSKNIIYKYALIAKQIIRTKPQNIVIGGFPSYYPIVFFLKQFLNYNIYCWWAGNEFTEPKNRFKLLYRIICAKSLTGCFFYSDYSKDYFLKYIKNFNPVHYKTVNNNTRIFHIKSHTDVINKEFSKNDSIFKIITIGFQEKRKNTILLLKSLTHVIYNNILVEVIGDGVELIKLKKYAKEHSLTNVIFAGKLSPGEVLQKISKSNLLIHTSFSDSWPQVINEAAINGIPYLISTKSGVSNTYTKQFSELVTFNPYNEFELAKKIQYLIDNPSLLVELGQYAQKDAFENDGKKVFTDFVELLS